MWSAIVALLLPLSLCLADPAIALGVSNAAISENTRAATPDNIPLMPYEDIETFSLQAGTTPSRHHIISEQLSRTVLKRQVGPEDAGMGSSGSGSAQLLEFPPVCDVSGSTLMVFLFDSVAEAFEVFGCTVEDSSDSVEYQFTVNETGVAGRAHQDSDLIFADVFNPGTYTISVTACSFRNNLCSMMTISVTLEVHRHGRRLLPFGSNYSDSSLDNADDRAVSVIVPNGIPFWDTYHNTIYLSTNGLVSFGRPHTSWWPIAFPYGRRSIPVIAPYWTDFDFRNTVTGSALYYHVYESDSSLSFNNRATALLREFSDRLAEYSSGEDFWPDWMIVVTWYKATPYYGRSNQDETVTFQLVLATDYVHTYTFFLYEEGGINWNTGRRQRQRIVIGYDAKDYINYHNVNLPSTQDILEIDAVDGNSNRSGQWYFNLTSPNADMNFDQLCLDWARRQPPNIVKEYFEGLPSCPCTALQAWRDWRFWFAFYWGFSSQPNCATMLFSRRQSTIECCYDSDGSLLVGPRTGGSYKLYNSLFFPQQYVQEDRQPYDYCCTFSSRCSTYYEYRPSDDCSAYEPLRFFFMWGDPHFRSVDNVTFTFNGIGEYVLLRSISNSNGPEIQARFARYDNASSGTVMTAVAIQQGNAQTVQIEVDPMTDDLQVYVDRTAHNIESGSLLVVDQTATFTDFDALVMNGGNMSSLDVISIRRNGSELVLSTASQASIMVSTQMTFLRVSVELSDEFLNDTEGLLGYYNGNPDDDFTTRNGTVLSPSLTEEELYDQFGLDWHVPSTDSIFTYETPDTYDTYNNGWNTSRPLFSSNITNPDPACNGDPSCEYDTAATGNLEVGVSSFMVSQENQETAQILENRSPNITGPMIVEVSVGESLSQSYTVEDEDGVDQFILKEPIPDGITLEGSGDTRELLWANPGFELPSAAIQLFANDTLGASTARNISIILCACHNNGTCLSLNETGTTVQYNDNGHYQLLCTMCGEFFVGDYCEIDTRGCELDPCPSNSECVANDSVPEGYQCEDCAEGYYLDGDGKCSDIDECNDTIDNCTQNCTNTDGSFECVCNSGYRLANDGFTCNDIDECAEEIDSCEQICTNNNGSYSCSCYPPYTTYTIDNTLCVEALSCTGNPCSGGISCVIHQGDLMCICPEGQQCTGMCIGDMSLLDAESQACEVCPPDMYGFNCAENCSCLNGVCDATQGCICDSGWRGVNCDFQVNDHDPVFASHDPVSVPRDLPAGSTVIELLATDSDTNPHSGAVSYILLPSNELTAGTSDGVDIFEIREDTGIVRLLVNLNSTVGNYSQFLLTIEARDNGQIPRSSQTTLTVVPITVTLPVPQFSQVAYNIPIPENQSVNSTILNLTCTEPDTTIQSSELVIAILPSNDGDLFAIEDGIYLILIQELDFEALPDPANPVYILTVTCTNQYNLTTTTAVEIRILNVDDNDFVFENDSYSVSVPENLMHGDSVLNVTALDADLPDANIIYTFQDDINDFSIIESTGEIYVSSPIGLDRETRAMYSLIVEARIESDDVAATETQVNITVLDENDNRPIFDDPGAYIVSNLSTRNELGDPVITVSATDDDLGENGIVTYELESHPFFAINKTTGLVYINSSMLTFGRFDLMVYAIDGGTPPLNRSALVDIVINPSPAKVVFNDSRPVFVIQEDHPRGSTIGTVQANVIDESNATVEPNFVGEVRYRIINGTDTMSFHIITTSGELILLTSLDFEAVETYLLEIEASLPSDPMVQPGRAEVRIDLTDINDNPPVFTPAYYARTVEEFTEASTSLFTICATDDDSGNNGAITFHLEDDFTGPFEIQSLDATTAVLSVATGGELDTPRDYRFLVIAEDGGSMPLTSEAVVFISVVRSASVSPTFTRGHYIFNISEHATIGSNIGIVTAVTEGSRPISEYPQLRYQIRIPDAVETDMGSGDNNDNIPFHIDPVSGNITSLTDFDAETRTQYAFYVEVYNTSNGMLFTSANASASVVVEIIDENDNAPVFSQSLYTVVINTSTTQGTTILTVSAIDGDSTNEQFDYVIPDESPLGFDILADGSVIVTNSTLYPGDYHLAVLAVDGEQIGSATIFVAVIPETPSAISFSEPSYTFAVVEGTASETLLGIVEAIDHLNMSITTGEVTYSFSGPNLTNCFHIDPADGEIRVSCTLDRETESHFELVVSAMLRAPPETTGNVKVVIDVLDINDNAPRFELDIYTAVIMENYGNSTPVETVRATDPDLEGNGTVVYSLLEDNFMLTPNATDLFTIDEISGDIFASPIIVPAGDYRLIAVARDLGSPHMVGSALVLICVTRPQPAGLSFITNMYTIAENEPTGTVVDTVQLAASGMIIDPSDYAGNLEFSIVPGGSSDLFHINPNNGTISAVTNLDREEAGSHVITIRASFSSFGIDEEEGITISVIDRNDEEPVFIPRIYSQEIDDSFELGSTVLDDVFARDLDAPGPNSEITFSIEDGTPFGINFTTGEIFVANISILAPGTYRFTITATDSGTEPLTGTAEIFIIVNHAVPQSISFPPSPYTFTLVENAPPDTFVGTVSVEQETPALDGLLYDITNGTGISFFHIDPFSGNITNLRRIDRETHMQFNLTVTALLPEEESLVAAVTEVAISIDDENDNRPIFVPSFYSTTLLTSELTTNQTLITLNATDADEGLNAVLQYAIEETTIASFSVGETGEIFVTEAPLPAAIYHMTVTATDRGNPPLTGTAVVVIDIQELIPSAIVFDQSQYEFLTSEYTGSGSRIGQVQVLQIQGADTAPIPEEFQQYINFATDSEDFTVSPTTGEIRSIIDLDYEVEQSYNFVVEARLAIPGETPRNNSATVTVSIQDENDHRPEFSNFPNTLSYPENRTNEENVTRIVVTDLDSGSNAELFYEIVNDVGNSFRIDSSTGDLYVAAGLDRETRDEYILNIRVSDMGMPQLSNEGTIIFTLEDINDNTPVPLVFEFQVQERTPVGTTPFTFTYNDPDLGTYGVARFIFLGGGGPFAVHQQSGVVTITSELDYEQQDNYDITLRLRDNFFNSDGTDQNNREDYSIRVHIIDVPDNVPEFSRDSYSIGIDPHLLQNEVVTTTVTATDADGNQIEYSIVDPIPGFDISTVTGTIFSTGDQDLTPESVFTLTVRALELNGFDLFADVQVTIVVLPEGLTFTESTYTINIPEDDPTGTTIIVLPIEQFSQSSDITYSIVVTEPPSSGGTFTSRGNGEPEVEIILASSLDRETVQSYTIRVNAERLSGGETESATTTLTVVVLDVNDNTPLFTDGTAPLLVTENSLTTTIVSKANATDPDYLENGRIRFSIVNTPLPFFINGTTGVITVAGNIDYETNPQYTLTVKAEDGGAPPRSATFIYTVNVINTHDEYPEFAAPAYFGEVYAGAPDNYRIHHVILEVTDRDDPANQQQILFRIDLPTGSGLSGYDLQVTDREPYYIVAVSIPDTAQSGIVKFEIEVTDVGGLSATVPLFLSIFTSSHIVPFTLEGILEDEFLSCSDPRTSVCEFSNVLSQVVGEELGGAQVSFYNDSVQESSDNIQRLQVSMYGWHGIYGARDNKGKLPTTAEPDPVNYITYDDDLTESVTASTAFNTFDFGVGIDDTVEPPTAAPGPGSSGDQVIVGIISVVVVVSLIIVLVIVLVVVFGRRRKPKSKSPTDQDPYDRDYSRSRSRRARRARTPRRKRDSEEIGLTSVGGSDLAYETMYDDDDLVGKQVHTPWFDPSYLARDKREDAQYEGDSEPTPLHTAPHRHGPMRATVDGDARRNRRHSSDESVGSVTELDRTEYLRGYQQSTPIQPGQRMGEFDMFAGPHDDGRPSRPSLRGYPWDQRKTSQV